jgi:hypothetical protein
MPAKSKSQQRFMGMLRAIQKGDMKAPDKEMQEKADKMKNKDTKEFASTKHKGLPEKVKPKKDKKKKDKKKKDKKKKKKSKKSELIAALVKMADGLDRDHSFEEADLIDRCIEEILGS